MPQMTPRPLRRFTLLTLTLISLLALTACQATGSRTEVDDYATHTTEGLPEWVVGEDRVDWALIEVQPTPLNAASDRPLLRSACLASYLPPHVDQASDFQTQVDHALTLSSESP